jgi:hypothetical protein
MRPAAAWKNGMRCCVCCTAAAMRTRRVNRTLCDHYYSGVQRPAWVLLVHSCTGIVQSLMALAVPKYPVVVHYCRFLKSIIFVEEVVLLYAGDMI